MVLPAIAIVALVALLSALIGGLIVYFDTRRRDEDKGWLWTGVTVLGFVFGILPGVVVILSYFIISRRL
jgi:ABC-type Fe3+ transport system permease subunit